MRMKEHMCVTFIDINRFSDGKSIESSTSSNIAQHKRNMGASVSSDGTSFGLGEQISGVNISDNANTFIITETALNKIKATERGESFEKPIEQDIQRHPQESLATIEENERRDIERKRIELSYERQINIIKEQNAILEEHLTNLKETQDRPHFIEKQATSFYSDERNRSAKEIESCLVSNPKQPLKCSEHVKRFIEASASLSAKPQ
jgi:hypothetical protein